LDWLISTIRTASRRAWAVRRGAQPQLIRAHHASPEGLLGGQKQVLVEGIRPDGRLDRPFLDIADGNAGVALVPPSVEVFGDRSELNRPFVG
jgi:hypothetical protein